jgi:hypothetical protein
MSRNGIFLPSGAFTNIPGVYPNGGTKIAIGSVASPTPPTPTTSLYYYLSDQASAVDHSHIYHLLNDETAIHLWDGESSDVLWATVPDGFGGGSYLSGVIATSSFVYLYGFAGGSSHLYRRSTSSSPGGNDWEDVALPTDLTDGTTTWSLMGYPWVAVDLYDNIHVLGGDNRSYVYWEKGTGDWSARALVFSETESTASPQPGFVWSYHGRTKLAIFDRYSGHSSYLSGSTWINIDTPPENTSPSGLFSVTGNDLYGVDGQNGTTGIIPIVNGAWQTELRTDLSDFAPGDSQATCFSMGDGQAMIVSKTEFSGVYYGLITNGSGGWDTDLLVASDTGNLQYKGTDVHAWPVGWIGSPGTGIGEALPDGSFLHSATYSS